MTPSIALESDRGREKTLLKIDGDGPAPEAWWPILDANDVCRYCLEPYPRCRCEEAR